MPPRGGGRTPCCAARARPPARERMEVFCQISRLCRSHTLRRRRCRWWPRAGAGWRPDAGCASATGRESRSFLSISLVLGWDVAALDRASRRGPRRRRPKLEGALALIERVAVVADVLAGLGRVPSSSASWRRESLLRVLCGAAEIWFPQLGLFVRRQQTSREPGARSARACRRNVDQFRGALEKANRLTAPRGHGSIDADVREGKVMVSKEFLVARRTRA